MPTASTPGAPLLARTFSHASTMRRLSISNDFTFGSGLALGSSPGGLGPGRPWSARPLGSGPITGPRGIHLTGLSQVNGSPWPGRPRALDTGRMSPLAGRLGWLFLGLGVSDQVPVAHRVVADGELEHAVEDQAPAAGSAPVEAEAELVQVALQVLVFH